MVTRAICVIVMLPCFEGLEFISIWGIVIFIWGHRSCYIWDCKSAIYLCKFAMVEPSVTTFAWGTSGVSMLSSLVFIVIITAMMVLQSLLKTVLGICCDSWSRSWIIFTYGISLKCGISNTPTLRNSLSSFQIYNLMLTYVFELSCLLQYFKASINIMCLLKIIYAMLVNWLSYFGWLVRMYKSLNLLIALISYWLVGLDHNV